MKSNFIKRLTDFYNSHTKCYCQALKGKKNKELYEEVMKNKPVNLESNNLNEIIYWELHNMKEYDICPICGNPKKNFQRMITGYGQTCSKECSQKDMRRILKGVNSRTEESKKRRAEKIHNIWINKTNEEKLKISEKIKITKQLKYGNVNWNNNEKQIKTCFEKYGYKSACQVPEIKERQKVTKMTKYYNTILNNNKHIQPLFSLEEFLKLTINNQHLKYIFRWKCNDCGKEFESKMNGNWYTKGPLRAYARCLNCFPILNEYLHSRRELKLAKYIEEIVPHNVIYGEDDTLRNIIKPYVIDIYIPEEKIAIEFNGLRWHNIDQHETGYHLNKTKMCENKGIKLIHVWEDEWDFKKEEVKKNLRNILNNYYKFDEPVVKLDRSLYCKLCIPSNYIIINEIEPEVILRTNENGISYKVENCGYLLCKKVDSSV